MNEKTTLLLLATALLSLVVLAAYWLWSPGYGETSGQGYQYAIALFSACNQKDEGRLQKITEMIDAALNDGQLQPSEAEWLSAIIDKGTSGEWEAASRDVRRLMMDQIKPAALPAG